MVDRAHEELRVEGEFDEQLAEGHPTITLVEFLQCVTIDEQGRIEDEATEAGFRVEYVNAPDTSQTCHACSRIGRRSQQAEFVCPHDDCHVTEFQADINAAANIASRVDPWGESVRWEPGRDDSPQDGSTRDSATGWEHP